MNSESPARRYTLADGIDGRRNFLPADIPSLLEACGTTLPPAQIYMDDVSKPEPWPKIWMSRTEYLARRLSGCAAYYFTTKQVLALRGPSPSKAQKDFAAITKATARLWSLLGLKPDQHASNLPTYPRDQLRRSAARCLVKSTSDTLVIFEKLESAIDSIRFLNSVAADAARIQQARKTDSRNRNSGDEPRRALVDHLMNVWWEVFEEIPRSGYDEANEEPTTPFLKFCIWVFARMGVKGTPAAVHKLIVRVGQAPPWGHRPFQSDKSKKERN